MALASDTSLAEIAANLDLVWLIVAAGLVMMMQVGFLLLEAGMVRSKNSINVAQKNLLDFVFGVVAFAAIGFMIAFGTSDGALPFGISENYFFLRHLTPWESGFFVFQVMFCGTAATIVSGAVAERMKLSAYVLGSLVLSGLIYPFFVHWAWGNALAPSEGAFLANLGFVDFAGSTVVHSTGGWVSLAACLVLGPRLGRFDENGRPVRIAGHSPVLSTTGALLLFIGWIGFNGGSTVQASADIAPIVLNTVLAGGIGACVGYTIGYYRDGLIFPEKSMSGMLGGLVAITAGCHVVEPGGALILGSVGATVAIFGNEILERWMKLDDAVGAIGVHAFAGVVGTLGLALIAPADRLPTGGRLEQLYIQSIGVGINFYWSFLLGLAFFWIMARTTRVRVSAPDEEMGLNVAEHGSRLGVGHVEDALNDLVRGTADLRHRLPQVAGDEAEKLTGLFNRLMDKVEEEERARDELQTVRRNTEENERVATLANATFEAIVMHNGSEIVDGNEHFSELVGLPLAELKGRRISEFLLDQDHASLIEEVDANGQFNREINIVRADGDVIPVKARGRAITYRGQSMHIGCLVDLREHKEAERRIRFLALHDTLTALPNRALFTERLNQSVLRSSQGASCAVVLIDLDHFKDVNDLYGHPAGDEVIREAARRLSHLIGPQDFAARLGGDEFAIILSNAAFGAQLEDFGRRLVEAFREPYDLGNSESAKCGVSVGAALCPEHASTAEELIGRADMALYHAKNSGRNTWRIYKQGMNALLEKRRALEVDIEAGLTKQQFELLLQPRICAATGEISSHEALLRWRHPERGYVSPIDFVPVAEVSGKIVPLGEWVIAQACRILKEDLPFGRLSINVSPIQVRHPDFLTQLFSIVESTGVDPGRIELEITESVLMDDDVRALQLLTKVKEAGFTIALDDFGTGYSSLSYLNRYPFDAIKIDRSFVANLGVEDNASAIVKSIIDLGAGLGMKVVAEGVETIEQAMFLARSGCDELQGFLLGRPEAIAVTRIADDIAAQLRSVPRPASRRGRSPIEAPM